MARVIPITAPNAAELAAQVLGAGGLVVLPTDTVYGVAAWLDATAIERIFAAKQRPPEKAVPVLLASADNVPSVAEQFPAAAQRLAAAFWPGPLTLALPKRADLPSNLSGLPTIGVRVPDHDGTRAVIAATGGALAVTSANRSDEPPACTVRNAVDDLGDAVALYLDGGDCPGGVPSTVVSFEGGDLRVVRPGPITEAMLRAALADDSQRS
ncbi:MAG: threonylcarbamoyl-AMP synthase [Chloroflexi bacterium]|jgi:L-threonylcarbamoyladenylate synthase|nr:threonylcarbamoyl-AMP synthase [Chloroflexota bacterium]